MMIPGAVALVVPQEVPNDETATLNEWLVPDGAAVKEGQPVASLTFSKVSLDLESPADGYLYQVAAAGTDVKVTSSIAFVHDSPNRPELVASRPIAEPTGSTQFTRKALEMIEANRIPAESFSDYEMVRERDVAEYLARQTPNAPPANLKPLSPAQIATAKALSLSKATIPHSYLTAGITQSEIEARLTQLAESLNVPITLTDLLVCAVSRAVGDHPKFNWSLKEFAMETHDNVNVGIAMNLPDGALIVPVLHGADKMTLVEIAAESRGNYKRLIRNQLKPSVLAGGTITVTTLTGTGIYQIAPIIVPGQTCILAIADPFAGAYSLTIGFDHRSVNGAEAAAFLVAVKDRMLKYGEC